MSDLIDRRSAIESIRECAEDARDNREWDMEQGYLNAIECIEEEPSAQPEIIRCKDCKHRIVNEHAGEKGYFNLKAMCEFDSGDPFELGRCAEDDEWFCADAERRIDG